MNRASLLATAAILSTSAAALANGRYPAASQLVADRSDPRHLVVSATFGLLESRDGGKTFGWMCEAAIGTSGQQDLMVAVAGSGTTVVAMFNGMATTNDGCTYRSAPELSDKVMGDLSASRSTPHELVAFWNIFKPGEGFASQVVHSGDDGHSWAPVGSSLPLDLLPLTIDIAPNRASRVYLSARTDKTKNFASVLLRSDDGGATFASTDIPDTEDQRLTYIAAVHPFDAERVYLRVYDTSGTVIQSTSDGGRTFQKVFTGTDQLLGFAISPDGTQMALGGPNDGIWIGAADGSNLTRRSDVGATCLTWASDGLYACANYILDGFSLGRSVDSAATFEGLFRFDSLCGRASCGGEATSQCSAEWDLIAPALGATCGVDASVVDSATSVPRRDGSPGEAGEAGGSRSPVANESNDDLGGCSVSRLRRMPTRPGAFICLIAAFARRKRRSATGSSSSR